MEDIGDVKYSILEPLIFTKRNPGWVLMDGQEIRDSALAAYGITKVPDVRGLFIRAMDLGRYKEDGLGDPEWEKREVGKVQMDEFKAHNHGGIWGGNHHLAGMLNDPRSHTQGHEQIKEEGGAETRPRNIPLYVYIKIN